MKTVSCIIPAYNEGSHIAGVLEAVAGHPLISEVLVIDDGSTDNTREVASAFLSDTVRLISQEKNGGKSAALTHGIREASGELLLFLDADLLNLDQACVTDLLTPVLEGKADISISLRKNTLAPWHWIGLDYISGERVIPKELLLPELERIETLRPFGVEVFINSIFIRENVRMAIVSWPRVISPFKAAKDGLWSGITGDVKMMRDIFSTMSPLECLRQIYIMRYMLSI